MRLKICDIWLSLSTIMRLGGGNDWWHIVSNSDNRKWVSRLVAEELENESWLCFVVDGGRIRLGVISSNVLLQKMICHVCSFTQDTMYAHLLLIIQRGFEREVLHVSTCARVKTKKEKKKRRKKNVCVGVGVVGALSDCNECSNKT